MEDLVKRFILDILGECPEDLIKIDNEECYPHYQFDYGEECEVIVFNGQSPLPYYVRDLNMTVFEGAVIYSNF